MLKLRARLGFAALMLIALPFIYALALGYLYKTYYDTQIDFLSLFGIAGGFAIFQIILLYFIGPLSIEGTYGNQIQWISRDNDPKLWDMIESRMKQAKVGLTKIGILRTDEMNAFVYGYGKKKGKLVITEGLLKHLDFDEVEGIVGHELGHVRHRDMTITLMLIAIPILIQTLYRFSFYASTGSRQRKNSWIIFILIYVLFLAAYLASFLLLRYVSRTREYYADSHSVKLLENPRPIVQGLAKLTYGNVITGDRIIKTHTATHALMIVSPMASASQADDARKAINKAKVNLDKYGDIGGPDIDEKRLESAMERELKEKGELMRTHPLTAHRILSALKYAEELKII